MCLKTATTNFAISRTSKKFLGKGRSTKFKLAFKRPSKTRPMRTKTFGLKVVQLVSIVLIQITQKSLPCLQQDKRPRIKL